MKAATGIGIGVAIVGLLLSATMEGTSPAAFINIPALLIVIVGTAGVSVASGGMEAMKRVPALYKKAMGGPADDGHGARVGALVRYAERARREGLLALENEVASVEDSYLKKGLQLVV